MATVNFINRKKGQCRAGLRAVLNYTMKFEKTEFEGMSLVSGMNCTPQGVYEEFINTKLLYGKDSQRMYYHFVQSFPKDENISPVTAHEVALKLAEFYSDFEVLVATHTDREHLHSHFVINSVSFETGKKLHQSAHAIQELRQKSDELCMRYGLSICKPKQDRTKTKAMSIGEYHTAVLGKSWKLQLANIIDECMKYADSRETFISFMESEGIKVKWTDSRKNITYELPDGKRCRDNKLHEGKYLKERMEKEFAIRREIIYGRTQAEEQATESTEFERRNDTALENNSRAITVSERGATRYIKDGAVYIGTAERDTELPHGERADEEIRYDDTGVKDIEQEILTGWEKEREILLSEKIQIAPNRMDADVAVVTHDFNGFGSNLLQFAHSVGQLNSDVTVEPPQVRTDKKAYNKTKQKKIAQGHNENDHEEQGFGMKMGGY